MSRPRSNVKRLDLFQLRRAVAGLHSIDEVRAHLNKHFPGWQNLAARDLRKAQYHDLLHGQAGEPHFAGERS